MAWACAAKLGEEMEYEVEGARPRSRPKKTWREIVEEGCQGRKLNKEDVMLCSIILIENNMLKTTACRIESTRK